MVRMVDRVKNYTTEAQIAVLFREHNCSCTDEISEILAPAMNSKCDVPNIHIIELTIIF